MSGPGDVGGDVSGDDAAWRDLIARFDVPTDRTTAVVPWPAVEDLPRRHSDAEIPGSAAQPHVTSSETAAGLAEAERGTTDPSDPKADPAGRTTAPSGPSPGVSGRAADPSGWAQDPGAEKADWPRPSDQISGHAAGYAFPADRTRVIRPARLPGSYTPPEDEDEDRYVPVPLPPPARLDSTSKAALAGVIGGPGYLLVASIFLHWTVSAEAALLAVAAFVGGFVTLIVKLGNRPGRDDDDDGAVL